MPNDVIPEICRKNSELLARLDERTNHMSDDIKEEKVDIKEIKETQVIIKKELSDIKTKMGNGIFDFSKREIVAIVTGLATIVGTLAPILARILS